MALAAYIYDLAGLYEDVRVKTDTFHTAQSLYSDTKAKVAEGALAELTRAEAQVAGAEQDLINSEGLYQEQEAIMKNILTRRVLQAQSLDVEMAKYEAGVSTASLVIQYQSYLAQARATELIARGNDFKARAALDRALGRSLEHHNITFEEAYRGQVGY
jgi:outer membrane protein